MIHFAGPREIRRWVSRIREFGNKGYYRPWGGTGDEERNRKSLPRVHASRAPFVVKPDDGDRENVAPRSTFLTSHAYMAALTRWDQTAMVIKANGTVGRDSGTSGSGLWAIRPASWRAVWIFLLRKRNAHTGQAFQYWRGFRTRKSLGSTLFPRIPSNLKHQYRISRYNTI